jgi:DNA helicase-2/ATP-dependent DNA helicase PcrA
MREQILADLNPPQEEAVLHAEGPLLILAGAGSGKTRVITRRIAHLIAACGVQPWQILAVTFTNKAAGEMRSRVEAMLGAGGLNVWVGTFHSTCLRILRKWAHALGLRNSFVVYDEDDSLSLIRDCVRELNFTERSLNPRAAAGRISRAKNDLLTPGDYSGMAGDFIEEKVSRVYPMYQERLRASHALDFDDLLLEAVRLLQTCPEARAYYQDLWRYVLVDEYQDTNRAQYHLVNHLTARHGNLCVVGDDDQSIYKWRGADLNNILDFERDHAGCAVIRLEQNYRSTQHILDAASAVVARNVGRKGKRLWTENSPGDPLTFYQAADEGDEADFVARTIRDLLLQEGGGLDDFAVFYRTNAQSRVLEDALRRDRTPYVIVGGVRFYERREIKDILAYLRLLANPDDSVALKRVINVPARGLGATTVQRLEGFALAEKISLLEACRRAAAKRLLPPKQVAALEGLCDLLDRLRARVEGATVADLAALVIGETGYADDLQAQHTLEADSRLENLRELVTAAKQFHDRSDDRSLAAFLDSVALIADIDQLAEGQGAVTLMTLHSAKGLEFPVVFITGMEEGVFPHARAFTDAAELEEERRLCYVGMTRAKERLFLSAAVRRQLYGNGNFNLPSRFLDEIPAELLQRIEPALGPLRRQFREWDEEHEAAAPARPGRNGGRAVDTADEPFVDFLAVGARVRHPDWGVGVIRERIGDGEDLKIIVSFAGVGRKKLAAKFAPLQRA